MEQQNLITAIQLLLDMGLIVFLMIFFWKRPKSSAAAQTAAPGLVESLEKVIEETKAIAESFDGNLKERQILIQQLLLKLDQKLNEAEKLCHRLEDLQQTAERISSTPQPALPRHPEHQEILRLAKRGLDATAIAKRVQKPLGEVELILSLQRITPAK